MIEERLQRVIDAMGSAPFRYVQLKRACAAVLDNADSVGTVYAALRKTGRIETIRQEDGFNVYRLKDANHG